MRSVTLPKVEANLPSILREVQAGERFVITDSGKPVAELGPTPAKPKLTFDEIVARMNQLREGNKLDGLTIQEMREEGRR